MPNLILTCAPFPLVLTAIKQSVPVRKGAMAAYLVVCWWECWNLPASIQWIWCCLLLRLDGGEGWMEKNRFGI